MSALTIEERTWVFQILADAKTEHFTPAQLLSLQIELANSFIASREVM